MMCNTTIRYIFLPELRLVFPSQERYAMARDCLVWRLVRIFDLTFVKVTRQRF